MWEKMTEELGKIQLVTDHRDHDLGEFKAKGFSRNRVAV